MYEYDIIFSAKKLQYVFLGLSLSFVCLQNEPLGSSQKISILRFLIAPSRREGAREFSRNVKKLRYPYNQQAMLHLVTPSPI